MERDEKGLGEWRVAYDHNEVDKWNLELASAVFQEIISEFVKVLFEGE